MSSFDFLQELPTDTLAEAAALPLKLIKRALDGIGRLVEPDSQGLSEIRREAFPRSLFRIEH